MADSPAPGAADVRAADRGAAAAPPSDTSNARFAWAWIAVLAIFALTRLAAFQQMGETVFARRVFADAMHYQRFATLYAAGHWQDAEAFFMAPIYPALLGIWYRLTEASVTSGRLFNMLCSLATLNLLMWCALRLGGHAAAIVAGMLWALCVQAIFHEQTILLETLAALFVLGSFAAFAAMGGWERDEPAQGGRLLLWACLIGFLTSCAILSRATNAVMLPIFLAAVTFAWRGKVSLRTRLLAGVLMTALAFSLVVVTAWHNWRAERAFIPITSNFGLNLYIGNNPEAKGVYDAPPTVPVEARGAIAAARALGKPNPSSKEIDAYWRGEALRFIRENPARFARITLHKVILLYYRHDFPQLYNHVVFREEMPILKGPLVGWGVFCPLAALGVLFLLRERRTWGLVLAAGLMLLPLTILPFFVTERYRYAYVPIFILAGAVGVSRILPLAMERAWHRLRAPVVALVIGVAVSWVPWIELFPEMRGITRAITTNTVDFRAAMYAAATDDETAARLLMEADRATLGPVGLFMLGSSLLTVKNQPCEALEVLAEANNRSPGNWEIMLTLARAAERCGRGEVARQFYAGALRLSGSLQAEDLLALGNLSLTVGDVATARDALSRIDLFDAPPPPGVEALRQRVAAFKPGS